MNPSSILVVGEGGGRLRKDLQTAGHQVNTAPSASSAKKDGYAVVVTDPAGADDAHSRFPSAIVVTRSGDARADEATIETRLTRTPVRRQQARAVLRGRQTRVPVAVGPRGREAPGTAEPAPAAEPPAPAAEPPPAAEPAPERAAAAPEPAPARPAREKRVAMVEKPVPAERPERTEEPAASGGGRGRPHNEYFFGFAKASLRPTLERAAKELAAWLQTHPNVKITLEGHTDSIGDPSYNQWLGEQRATAIRAALVADGIPADRISVASAGASKPKYGPRDRRNRRVSVSFDE